MSEIIRIDAFQDNYIWLIKNNARKVIVVDPGDARPVIDYLNQHHLGLAAIFITHHHFDHSGGIAKLLQHWSVPVYGGHQEPIQHLSNPLKENDRVHVELDNHSHLQFRILEIPGHTLGHIAFVGENLSENSLFCGDTLFTAGCGRLFEGTAKQMLHSLQKLKSLPADTKVYCGHEYTQANLKFALEVEPHNEIIQMRFKEVSIQRNRGEPTVPASLEIELKTNPFLRTYEKSVIEAANHHARKRLNQQTGQPLLDESEVFAEIRLWKDGFMPS